MPACERYFQHWDVRHDVYWHWCSDKCPEDKPAQIVRGFKKNLFIAACMEAKPSGDHTRLKKFHEELLALDDKVRDSWELMQHCSPLGEEKFLRKFDDAREALYEKILELRYFIRSIPLPDEEITLIASTLEHFEQSAGEPNESAQETFGSKAYEGTPQLSLDVRALAVFIENPELTKVQIAKRLKCNEKSLAPIRCPKLTAAINATKAKIDPTRPSVRGKKGKDRELEAWNEDDERTV